MQPMLPLVVIALVIVLVIVRVQSQTWIGTYTAVGASCSTLFCCCMSGQVVLTQPSPSILAFTSGLAGQCLGLTSYTGSTYYPMNNTGSLTFQGQTLTLELGSDNRTITVFDPAFPLCTGTAIRNGATTGNDAVKQHASPKILLALILVGLVADTFNV